MDTLVCCFGAERMELMCLSASVADFVVVLGDGCAACSAQPLRLFDGFVYSRKAWEKMDLSQSV